EGVPMSRLVLAALLLLPVTTHAANQNVLGDQLIVKNPSTPEKRKITVKAKELASDDTIVGDPVTNGGTLTVQVSGGTLSNQTYTLPTGTSPTTSKPFWSGDAVKGFKYKDAKGENGPVSGAQIKLKAGVFQIKATIAGKLGSVTVLPPNLGTDGCALL